MTTTSAPWQFETLAANVVIPSETMDPAMLLMALADMSGPMRRAEEESRAQFSSVLPSPQFLPSFAPFSQMSPLSQMPAMSPMAPFDMAHITGLSLPPLLPLQMPLTVDLSMTPSTSSGTPLISQLPSLIPIQPPSAAALEYSCPECHMQFRMKKNLQHHVKKFHKECKFICRYCEKKFDKMSHLLDHEVIHTDRKDFACEYCFYKTNRKSSLVSHTRKIHNNGERKVIRKPGSPVTAPSASTPAINSSTDSPSSEHLPTPDTPTHSQSDSQPQTLTQPSSPVQIQTPSQSQSQTQTLNQTSCEIFKCPSCDFTSQWKNSLKQHVDRKHLNINSHLPAYSLPFACSTCPSRFESYSEYRQHLHHVHGLEKRLDVSLEGQGATGSQFGYFKF